CWTTSCEGPAWVIGAEHLPRWCGTKCCRFIAFLGRDVQFQICLWWDRTGFLHNPWLELGGMFLKQLPGSTQDSRPLGGLHSRPLLLYLCCSGCCRIHVLRARRPNGTKLFAGG